MRKLFAFFYFSFSVTVALAQTQVPPKTYAVIVGISDYENKGIEDLQFANSDATAFAHFLKSKAGGSVPQENIKLFIDSNATNAAIYSSFSWLIENVEPHDLVYIYFAGHGDMESETAYKLGFLLTYQTPRRTFINNAVRIEDLNNYANTLALKAKVIVITDACHSGSIISTNKQLRTVVNNQLTTARSGIATARSKPIRITSCLPDQLSMEDEYWGGGHGVFSYYLVNGMIGLAEKNQDGFISIGEIKNYLNTSLANDSLLIEKKHQQNPVLNGDDSVKLAVIDKDRLAQLRLQIPAQMPAPIVTSSGFSPELSATQLLANMFRFLNNTYIEGFFDFKKLLLQPEDQLLNEVIQQIKNKLISDSINFGNEFSDFKTLTEARTFETKSQTNNSLWKQFNYNFLILLDKKTQKVINDYLEGDAAELERRRYYNSKNNGYDEYPFIFKLAMKLAANDKPLYDIFEIKYHYFSGVALRLKIPTVENPMPFIDSAFKEQQKAVALDPNAAYIHNELGTLYLYKKEYKLAEEHYNQATFISPDWVLPWANLMALYIATKDTSKALASYATAKSIQPDFQSLFVNAGILNEQKNNLLVAEEMFRKSIKLNSRHYFPFERLGYVYMNTTSYAQADSFFYEADIRKRGYHFNRIFVPSVHVEPFSPILPLTYCNFDTAAILQNDAIGYFAWGLLNYNSGNKTGAEAKFKKVIALDKSNPLAFHYLGLILYQQERWQEGDLIFNFAVTYYLNDERFNAYCDSLLRFAPASKVKECVVQIFRQSYYNFIEDHYYLGTLYETWNHFTEAEAQYRKIITLTPDFMGGYHYLWNMLEKINRFEEAEKIIYQFKSVDRDRGEGELRMFYKRMMGLFPSNADWFFRAGSFLYQLAADNPKKYENDFKRILPDNSKPTLANRKFFPPYESMNLPFANKTLEVAGSVQEPLSEAIEFFLKADSLIDNSLIDEDKNIFRLVEINDHLGDLYVWQGLKELAGKHYEKAINLQPMNTGIRLKTIDVHDANYQFSDALIHLEILAGKKELNYSKEVLLAKYEIHSSKFNEAMLHLKNAESIHPYKMAEIIDLFGRLALLNNKPKDAINFYKEYLSMKPNDHEAMYSIARMFAKAGNKKEAWKWLKASMENGFIYSYVLQFDPYWESYRKQTQWKKLLANYKMREYPLPPPTVIFQ